MKAATIRSLHLSVTVACAVAGATMAPAQPARPAAQATALGALKLLPRPQAEAVVAIVGRDGTPAPERWYVIVHDPAAAAGFRELVVAGGEIVASRTVSQFVEAATPQEIVGDKAIQVDSDRAAAIAQEYAFANNAVVTHIDYELKREGSGAAPLWIVTCLDDAGQRVGQVRITASRGTVVGHDGFAAAPRKAAPQATPAEFDTWSETAIATPTPSPSATASSSSKRRKAADDDDEDHGSASHGLRKVGGKLQRFFTGHDTISR